MHLKLKSELRKDEPIYRISSKERRGVSYKIQLLDAAFDSGRRVIVGGE